MNKGDMRQADRVDSGHRSGLAPPPNGCALLMPVWGSAFVRQFLDFCLPTLLADGNIPALARALPTQFVLLTRSSDVAVIAEHPAWQHLTKCCETDIQTIDDLITDGNHHATITLAYTRALRASGQAIRDTVFLFLVADYLVADGSLSAVLRRIQAGASGVLAGSLQIAAEAAIPLLRERLLMSKCVLSLPPRLLANWAVTHLHPNSAGSVVNTSLLHNADTNRLFWSVDRNTLIGRFYLLHMIGIRPEVTEFVVGAPCDYSFIPELCPSNRVDVLTDSDEYLAVEMQACGRASESLRRGPLLPSELARSLSQWTTARHRQNVGSTLIFHAADRPGSIVDAEAMASAFTTEVGTALAPRPLPHRGHPIWTGMMALQRVGRAPAPDGDDLARLLGTPAPVGGVTGLLWRLRLQVLGHPPKVTAVHPRWPDFQSVYTILKSRLGRHDRLLVVSAAPRAYAQWLGSLCDTVESIEPEPISNSPSEKPSGFSGTFDACVWIADGEQLSNDEAFIDRVGEMLKPGGCLIIFCAWEFHQHLAGKRLDCAGLGLRLRQSGIRVEETRYVPAGSVRIALAQAMAGAIRAGRGRPRVVLPFLLAVSALIATAVLGYNLMILSRRLNRSPRGSCSSTLIVGRRQTEPSMSAVDCQDAHGYDGLKFAVPTRARPTGASESEFRVEPRPLRPARRGMLNSACAPHWEQRRG